MRLLIAQGVPLSLESRMAWKTAGWTILKNREEDEFFLSLRDMRRQEPILLLNAGMSWLTSEKLHNRVDILINPGEQIEATRRPQDIRANLGEFLPPWPTSYPAEIWMKGPGRQGNNKEKTVVEKQPPVPRGWDIQQHIEGTEYRLITVGDRVVQVLERGGTNEDREYTWVGVTNGPDRLIGMAKRAAARLDKPSVIAWDMIHEKGTGTPFILEANSAPGMSEPTAARITDMVYRLYINNEGEQE